MLKRLKKKEKRKETRDMFVYLSVSVCLFVGIIVGNAFSLAESSKSPQDHHHHHHCGYLVFAMV